MVRVGKKRSNALLTTCFILVLGCNCLLKTSQVKADQNHPSLNGLFEQLKTAESNSATKAIEEKIWFAWLEAPDTNSESLMSQITYAMSLRQFPLAVRFSDQLIDSNPDFAEAWNKRATIHYLMGNHALSVSDIKETLLLEPRHFGALSGLGLIFLSSGNAEAAVDAYNSVMELSPASDNARANLARAKSMIGKDI